MLFCERSFVLYLSQMRKNLLPVNIRIVLKLNEQKGGSSCTSRNTGHRGMINRFIRIQSEFRKTVQTAPFTETCRFICPLISKVGKAERLQSSGFSNRTRGRS